MAAPPCTRSSANDVSCSVIGASTAGLRFLLPCRPWVPLRGEGRRFDRSRLRDPLIRVNDLPNYLTRAPRACNILPYSVEKQGSIYAPVSRVCRAEPPTGICTH